ncbi:MAG TPA: aspartate aminotransferase, partial [Clostridium sp.]|nr:aspartate aminotransferase [Clostridium sp.]
MILSKKAEKIKSSITLEITAKANEMKSTGIDVIGFGAGEPDFNTPENIQRAAVDAMKKGHTKYTPASGILELKKAVSRKFKRDNGLNYNTDQIIISTGAKQCLCNAFEAVLNPGDEVIIPVPYWVSYPEMVKLCGGTPVFVPTTENDGFILKADTLKKYIDKKTKILIINSPNNPCGSVYSKQDLEQIAKLAIENNIFVISDEIYEKLIYDCMEHVSIVSYENMIESSLLINGLSKTFAMTGWRIGFAAGPKQLIEAMENFQSHSTSNPNSIAQR